MKFFQRRNDEQEREAYRVRLERGPLRAFLVLDDVPQPAELIDLSSGGCALRLPREARTGPAEGDPLTLRFDIHDRSLFGRAVVRYVEEDGIHWRIGAQFVERERLWQQLDEDLWRFFNRRQAFRVRPAPAAQGPASVTVRWADVEREDVLHDVSTSGLSLRVSTKDDVVFPRHELVQAELRLPPNCEPFRLGLVFVHDTVVRGSRRVGFRFDPVGTPHLAREQERILQYVLARQRAVIRERDAQAGAG